jgi:hypothetical protein
MLFTSTYNNTETEAITHQSCSGNGKKNNCIDVVDGYDVDVTSSAPYSHDAQSCINCTSVPEPSTLLLIGSGLIGLGLWGRKRIRG